jgi:hypothetical protein
MISLCFVAWCLGNAVQSPTIRMIATQDVYHKGGVTNRLIAVESPWLIGGYVHQPDTEDAVFGGVLPVRIHLFGPRAWVGGGAIVATSDMPRRGTHTNWFARVQVNVTRRIALEIVHVSNGGLKNVANPAIDSLGLSVRLR